MAFPSMTTTVGGELRCLLSWFATHAVWVSSQFSPLTLFLNYTWNWYPWRLRQLQWVEAARLDKTSNRVGAEAENLMFDRHEHGMNVQRACLSTSSGGLQWMPLALLLILNSQTAPSAQNVSDCGLKTVEDRFFCSLFLHFPKVASTHGRFWTL